MIDSRILEMVFKNKQFEDGVNESINSLNKLDRSLDKIDGSTTSSALDKIGGVCDTVGQKFSVLETLAKGALLNIGAKAADVATDLAYSLSLEQVTKGWSKFNDKTTAMQTIMNNAHKENGEAYDIDEVNEQMEKLNWFTDETSYNFTDMVSNIGKFTSMGKGLEDSVTAMEGISVWASAAGQGVNEASRAMYNLSQAMGVGALKLQDWKSIQNANMATEQFKEQAMESAVQLGSLEKKLDEATGKFKYFIKGTSTEVSTAAFDQTLSEGWLDSNVLMDTLKEYGKFADELNKLTTATGMEATQLVNDNNGLLKQYAAAADKMTFLNDYIKKNNVEFEDEEYTVEQLAKALDKLNSEEFALSKKAFKAAQEAKTLTEAIDATKDAVSTGWMNIFEQIFGNYEEAKKVWSQLAEDLYSIFTPFTEGILDTLKAWRMLDDVEGAAGTREDLFNSLHDLLTILFDIDEEVVSLAGIISDAWQEIFPSDAESNALRFANVIIWLKNSVEKLGNFVKSHAESIGNIFKGIFAVLKLVKTAVIVPIKSIIKIFKSLSGDVGGGFVDLLGNIGAKLNEIATKGSDKIISFFDKLVSKVHAIKVMYNKLVANMGDKKANIFSAFTEDNKIYGIAKSLVAIKQKFDVVKEAVDKFIKAIKSIGTIWRSFKAYENVFKETFNFSDVSKQSTPMRKILLAVYVVVQKLKKAFTNVKDTFSSLKDTLKKGKDNLTDTFEKPRTVVEALKTAIGGVGTALGKIVDKIQSSKKSEGTFSKLFKFFQNLFKILKAVWSVVKGLFDRFLDGFNAIFNNLSVETLIDLIKSGIVITFFTKLVQAVKKFVGIGDSAKGLLSGFGETLSGIQESIENFNKGANVKLLKQIAVSVLILVVALLLLSTIDAESLAEGVLVIGTLMAELYGFLTLTSKSLKNSKAFKNVGKVLTKLATSLLILAVAMKILASVDKNNMDNALAAVSILMAEMTVVALVLSKYGKKMKTSATALVGMAAAMILLSIAVAILGKMDVDTLDKGVLALTAIFGVVAAFMIAMKQGGNMISIAFSMMLLATAMNIMAGAVKNLGSMGTEELIQGLLGLGIAMGEMVVALLLLSDEKVLSGAAAMLIVAAAMLVLVPALLAFSALSWENLLKGLLGLGIAMAEMVVALKELGDPKVLLGAAAMLILAAALLVLTPAMVAFSLLSWEGLIKSLIMLAGVMAIFVAAMLLLAPVGPVILAVAGAFALFGVAILAIGAGVALLSAGLAVLVGVGSMAITMVSALLMAVIEAIPMLITAVGMGIVALILAIADSIDAIIQAVVIIVGGILEAVAYLIPSVLEIIGLVISGVLDLLIENTPKLFEWLGQVLDGVLTLLTDNTPHFFEWLGQILEGIFDLLIEYTPKLFEWLGEVLDGLIDLLGEYIPKLVKTVLDIVVAIMRELADHVEDFVHAALDFIAGFIRGIADGLPAVIDAAFKLVIAFIQGLADAIRDNNEALFDAIYDLLEAVIEAIVNFFKGAWKRAKTAGQNFMKSGFIKGLKDKISNIKDVVGDIAEKIGGWFKGKWESMKEIGGNLIEGLKNGMKETGEKIKDTVTEVAGKVTGWFKSIFGIESPSKVFAELGMYNMLGLAEGIEDYADVVEDSAEDVGKGTMDAIGEAMADVSDMLQDDPDMTPTITPVLDLSQIQKGARNLDSYFDGTSVGITASSFNAARAAKVAQQNRDNASMASALKYYTDKMVAALNNQNNNTNVNVTLEGDAAGIFRTVRTQNDRYKIATGRSALI